MKYEGATHAKATFAGSKVANSDCFEKYAILRSNKQ